MKPEVIEHLKRKELAAILKMTRAPRPDLRNHYLMEARTCKTKIDYLISTRPKD